MKKQDAKKKIEQLTHVINEHNDRYYNQDDPSISDKEYDDLLKELTELEEEFPEFQRNDSPTLRVGTKIDSALPTVTHNVKMLSLDNTYSREELEEWHARIKKKLNPDEPVEFVCELKIDGVSASLTYEKGVLTLGATRGDGVIGEDITNNLKTIHSIPLRLKGKDVADNLDVRAEVFMRRSDFEKLNAYRKRNDEALFANPRNAASGSVKLLDSRVTAKRNLQCYIHSFGQMSGQQVDTHWEFFQLVKKWGFLINEHSRLCQSFDEVLDYYQELLDQREKLDYEVDGVVIKVNSLTQQKRLGFTLKSPRWAVAYKFPAYQATTVIEKVSVQVGRTGVLTPVAHLKPVQCAGVVISRSTLHNFDEVKRLNVKIGDRVLIERAGDVIPKIVKVVETKKGNAAIKPPKACPDCGGKVFKEEQGAVAYRCINPLCPQQLERRMIHFASRKAMDIEGLGVAVVRQLIAADYIHDFADIYDLKREELLKLDLFKEKKADNLLKNISKSKDKPLSKLLFGLGILNVGEKAAATLAREFGSMDRIMQAKSTELTDIHEIGEVMADSIAKFFQQADTKTLVKKLQKHGLTLSEARREKLSDALAGQKFVFTGELSDLTRQEAAEEVAQRGGEAVSSVSRKTDYVVAGKNPGSKYKKAKDLGVKVLNEKQFKELLNE